MIDESAFTEQYVKHAAGIVRYLAYKFGDRMSEDLAATAWMKAWRHRDQFNGGASFKTWVIQIAINQGIYDHRRNRHRVEVPLTLSIKGAAYSTNTTERGLIAAETLSNVVSRVPDRDCEMFHMRYVLELGVDDVAGRLKLNVSTVKTRMRRALSQAVR